MDIIYCSGLKGFNYKKNNTLKFDLYKQDTFSKYMSIYYLNTS